VSIQFVQVLTLICELFLDLQLLLLFHQQCFHLGEGGGIERVREIYELNPLLCADVKVLVRLLSLGEGITIVDVSYLFSIKTCQRQKKRIQTQRLHRLDEQSRYQSLPQCMVEA